MRLWRSSWLTCAHLKMRWVWKSQRQSRWIGSTRCRPHRKGSQLNLCCLRIEQSRDGRVENIAWQELITSPRAQTCSFLVMPCYCHTKPWKTFSDLVMNWHSQSRKTNSKFEGILYSTFNLIHGFVWLALCTCTQSVHWTQEDTRSTLSFSLARWFVAHTIIDFSHDAAGHRSQQAWCGLMWTVASAGWTMKPYRASQLATCGAL